MKHILTKADFALFIIIVLLAVLGMVLFFNSSNGETAVIRLEGEVIKQVSLNTDQLFYVNNVGIQVKDGKIAFVASDCPTKVCIKMGWISAPGASAACLPNRISITVMGDSGVDAVAE